MNHPILSSAFVCVCLAATPSLALDIPAEHHAWGRFAPGSWARWRLTTYVTDAGGNERIEQVATITTRLEQVEPDGVTLTRETRIDGEAATETARYGWDDLPIESPRKTRLSLGEVKIMGTTYVCQTHEVTSSGPEAAAEGEEAAEPARTTETKWWYCPDRAPYLLKKIARSKGPGARFASWEVTRFGVPRQVLEQERPCTEATLIENTPQQSTKSTVFLAEGVPGGVVYRESETRDKARQGLIERARLELEAYEVSIE